MTLCENCFYFISFFRFYLFNRKPFAIALEIFLFALQAFFSLLWCESSKVEHEIKPIKTFCVCLDQSEPKWFCFLRLSYPFCGHVYEHIDIWQGKGGKEESQPWTSTWTCNYFTIDTWKMCIRCNLFRSLHSVRFHVSTSIDEQEREKSDVYNCTCLVNHKLQTNSSRSRNETKEERESEWKRNRKNV